MIDWVRRKLIKFLEIDIELDKLRQQSVDHDAWIVDLKSRIEDLESNNGHEMQLQNMQYEIDQLGMEIEEMMLLQQRTEE